MSKNLQQVYVANPITTNQSTDLMYFARSPYGASDDCGMTYANFALQFGSAYTASALTKTDDTNVTLTLGGTPATALLQATSITAGWTGTLSGTRGGNGVNNGTNTNTFAGNLNFANSFTTSGNFAVTQTYTGITNVTFPTSGTLATTSQLPTPAALTQANDTNVTLTLGGTPATALLQATSITAGWTGTLAPSRGGLGTGTAPNAGQIPIGTSGNVYTPGAINSGTGILVANASGSITISTTGGGVAWSSIAGTTQAAAVNTGYIVANASQTTITLPATAAIGDTVKIRGLGAAGWILAANTGQTIKAGSQTTSSAGSLTSAEQYDSVDVTCIVANTTWSVSAMGPTSGFTYL